MIIFGTRGSRRPEVLTEHTCSACGKEHSIFVVPFQRYFHVFWIPMFPIGTENVIVCGECGATFTPEKYPLSIEVRNQIKTPKWAYTGLILTAPFFCFIFISMIIDGSKSKQRIADAERDLIFSIKYGPEKYSIIKITDATADSCFFTPHQFAVNNISEIKDLKLTDFATEPNTYRLSRKDFYQMLENQTIWNIAQN